MSIKIYNTLTNKKEEFKSIIAKKVGMYVCGVTVYGEPHIGHIRSAAVFEMVRRYLEYAGYEVRFVRNVTDVDDKIIEKAREEKAGGAQGDLKEVVKDVAERYLKAYYEALEFFGIDRADVEPKATGHIKDMIEVISGLIEKGAAYSVGGDVYFRVKSFPEYGKLSNRNVEEMGTHSRLKQGEQKEDALDFALWKGVKEDEPYWESPWGKGRPGWHIECSAMSMRYLGVNFDIHGGGLDLIFPHHENEIMQSETYSSSPFANYWMHNGLLTINKEKMAKSLGNFVSVEEFREKYHPEVLKLFFLSAHYKSPIDFSYQRMEEVKKARQHFYILFGKVEKACGGWNSWGRKNSPAWNFYSEFIFSLRRWRNRARKNKLTPQEFHPPHAFSCKKNSAAMYEEFRKRFEEAMDDDFNTSLALGVLFEMVNYINKRMAEGDVENEELFYGTELLLRLGRVLGLFKEEWIREELSKDIDEDIGKMIEERNEARKRKDFAAADRIRAELLKKGIVLEDAPEGTVWRHN